MDEPDKLVCIILLSIAIVVVVFGINLMLLAWASCSFERMMVAIGFWILLGLVGFFIIKELQASD